MTDFLKQLREDIEDAKRHKLLVEITNDDILWLLGLMEKMNDRLNHTSNCDFARSMLSQMSGGTVKPCDCELDDLIAKMEKGPQAKGKGGE